MILISPYNKTKVPFFAIKTPHLKKQIMGHLTSEQRYAISVLLRKDYKQKDIAEAIGKDPSVVSREIKRNKDQRNGYYNNNLYAL